MRRVADNGEVALLPSVEPGLEWVLAASPGGRILRAQYMDGRTILWDVEKQQQVITNIFEMAWADFDRDGEKLVASCGDGQLRQFALNPFHELPSLALGRSYNRFRLRPQGDWFAGYTEETTDVEVRDLRDGSLVRTSRTVGISEVLPGAATARTWRWGVRVGAFSFGIRRPGRRRTNSNAIKTPLLAWDSATRARCWEAPVGMVCFDCGSWGRSVFC